ncbi:Cenp-O kinetochore centromere component-domain-containing protein [Diplogelasinospora grovesii]|uniref:Cenp-O kinetochore centromere component-domain-containing protein n=1 Tax=Diplogelasinospora grovesii TaxID=303347 RepID=A0AAN6NC82_9PEZI|nr:Cenp-O kinetochore centromere component-domain-containing protein [Diplogelasinospora grovesii]
MASDPSISISSGSSDSGLTEDRKRAERLNTVRENEQSSDTLVSSVLSIDDEMEKLNERANAEQVSTLQKQLRIQVSTLIASYTTGRAESRTGGTGLAQLIEEDNDPLLRQNLATQLAAQNAHNQQCLYRTCAGVTSFRVQDPDPNAVDGGRVLGIRIEAVRRAKFLRPYYVLLNRPYPNSQSLRVHRHTIPPGIPLSGLAARCLPPPQPDQPAKQDLVKFVRSLRREIVRHHHRLYAVSYLRKAANLNRRAAEMAGDDERLVDIYLGSADAEAKHVEIEYADGRTGRLVMGDDGELTKVVVVSDTAGRDREAVRELLGNAVRVEDVSSRLINAVRDKNSPERAVLF